MATLALAAAGAAAGSALLPTGLSVLGASISGATIGAQVGALAGAYVDQALFASSGQSRTVAGPRLSDLRVMASTEGAPIPRVYGRARVGGQVIWATDFEEEVVTTEAGGGGKGGGSGSNAASRTDYRYYANFAVAIAAGEITGIGRIWADNRAFDLEGVTYRVYKGSETQPVDSLILAHLGANAPAYRGVAYVVFERLDLAGFGNRLPQLSFEVFRSGSDLPPLIKGVVLIPGSGEFFASPTAVTRIGVAGERVAENIHTAGGLTDATVSLDQLQDQLPNVAAVSLVSSWFGSDLRCGSCEIRPKVEIAQKDTSPVSWSVAGLTRQTATVVSQHGGRAAYGGTPSDASIIACIRDLAARGLSVTLNPFILMDVPTDNALPDPWSDATAQPAYPWRGRITCHPAPGRSGSPDKSAVANGQLAAFIGTAAPTDFTLVGDAVVYTGPAEWSYRRFILHHAWLAKAAGSVSAFLIGSELRGLTAVRASQSDFPFVDALVALAADVRAVLGAGVDIVYAADWSEYFGHQPADGTGDVYFHLDPLWSSSAIDAIGIDCYWPLADWRDADGHLDLEAGARSPYDLAYLKSNLTGGEGYDWYYASAADRDSQIRTPITDGAGKPWVFRFKNLKSWWLNHHFDRPGGAEQPTPTGWVPQSKPIWLMEVGCGAVDKGANQPNVFTDPKSAEDALPYHSTGRRDDLAQRRYLQALLEGFDATTDGYVDGLNPVSSVYAAPMVDVARTHVYAWDLRPYPAFPADTETWGDGGSWRLGHWLNGRATGVTLAEAVAMIAGDFGTPYLDGAELDGLLPGYVVDRIMSPRDALQPLELGYFFDSIESDARIVMRHRADARLVALLEAATAVEIKATEAPITIVRAQETDLPASAKIMYVSGNDEYRQAAVEARRLTGVSGRVAQAELPIVLDPDAASGIADSWLFEAWSSRERVSLGLPPSLLAVEPGDAIEVVTAGRRRLVRVTEVADHGARQIEGRTLDRRVYGATKQPDRALKAPPLFASGQPLVRLLDLPLLTGSEPATAGYVAAAQSPWPGPLAIYRSAETTGYSLTGIAQVASTIGSLIDALPAAVEGRIDAGPGVRLALPVNASLTSVTATKMLSGANAAAILSDAGDWEVVQFERAELLSPGTFRISRLLRGQAGTEPGPIAAGAPFVLLDAALVRLDLASDQVVLPFNWRVGPASRDLGSDTYAALTHAFRGIGARPLSPVHIVGRRVGDDLHIGFVRRTRSGGDSWEAAEVPLAEETEAYEIDILSGGGVVRTIATPTPTAVYAAAQQIADFGALQASVTVRVCQLSSSWGRGATRIATI